MKVRYTVSACLCFLTLFATAPETHSQAQDHKRQADPTQAPADAQPQPPQHLNDQPTDAYRLELLDSAWRAATSYPITPHIKNRGRAEQQVVDGALAIDQPQLGWDYANRVVNWRRGACYAEIAHYLIDRQEADHAAYFLDQALRHSKDPKQGWRHQRVKARVASARVRMGLDASARELIESDDAQAQGETLAAEISRSADEHQAYKRYVTILDDMASKQDYEQSLAAMNGYAELYRIHFDDASRREALLGKTHTLLDAMPGFKRFEILSRYVQAAIDNNAFEDARQRLAEAEEIYNAFRWPLEMAVSHRSQMARHLIALDDREAARQMLDGAVALADEHLPALQDFERADALCPVAEGFAALGDQPRALRLYKRVVALGSDNPNIRPRVSDITATCVSMATHGCEPDKQLAQSIEAIVAELENR